MLEEPQWRAWIKAVRKRYKARLLRPDIMLAGFSAVALTRAFIFLFPGDEPVTFPPDAPDGGILIPGLAYAYGIIWLVVAVLGFYAAVEHRLKWLARVMLMTVFSLWALLYTIAGILGSQEPSRYAFGWAAVFLIFAVMVSLNQRFNKREPQYVLIPLALLQRLRQEKPSPVELVAELHQHTVSEDDLLELLDIDWRL